MCRKLWTFMWTKVKKNLLFLINFYFKQWKINFWGRKCDFFKYFFKFQFILFNCSYFFVNFALWPKAPDFALYHICLCKIVCNNYFIVKLKCISLLIEKNFEQKIHFCLLKMRFFLKKRNPIFSIKLGQRLPKSFSQLHVKNSRFFLS